MNYEIAQVSINTIRPGDTVMHNGVMRTVCRVDIRHNAFHGTTLFGDSYCGGRQPVQRVIIHRAMPVVSE